MTDVAIPEKTEPTERERKRMAEAAQMLLDRRPKREGIRSPKIVGVLKDDGKGGKALEIGPGHDDINGYSAQLIACTGVEDERAARLIQRTVVNSRRHDPITDDATAAAYADKTDEALAFVAEIAPRNAIEAALAVQMVTAHEAAQRMAGLMNDSKDRAALIEYARLMNQTQRTFTAQIEALSKLRTGGKQQVEVRYVYVDARTQTVVNGAGVHGVEAEGGGDAPALPGAAPVDGLPVWGADAGRNVVPIPRHSRQASLPDARGKQSGRTKGTG